MSKPRVSILVPNYKTPELTKLCMRLLRKYTDPKMSRVIVIDNDSQDESLSYLKKLSWIHLIERPRVLNEQPVLSHARALDWGLSQVDTPYVLSIHTDTLIKHPQWLSFLVAQMEKNPVIAGVGSWKLEAKPWLKRFFKQCERFAQHQYQRLIKPSQNIHKNNYYLRSHCALYRMDLIKKYNLSFADQEEVAGKIMHQKLIGQGHQMIFLPSEILGQYVDHINHATTLLNPEFKDTIRRNRDKALKRMERRLRDIHSHEILMEIMLDS